MIFAKWIFRNYTESSEFVSPRAHASFGIHQRRLRHRAEECREGNCTPSIITVPRSAATTKKISFATNNVLLVWPRWHMKDDHNEAHYILTWQIAIAHVTSRLAESRLHACVHACSRARLNGRNLDRVSRRGEIYQVPFEYFLVSPERHISLRYYHS